MSLTKFFLLVLILNFQFNCNSPKVNSPCEFGSETFNQFAVLRVATNDPTPYCNLSFSKGRNSSNPTDNPNSFSEMEVFDGTTKLSSGFTKIYPSIISTGTLASKKTFNFTIKNTGNTVLNITSMNITGSTFFTLTSAPVTTIAANSESIISVRYEPTLVGTHLGTLTIVSDSRTNPSFTIALSGSGIAFPIAINLQVYYKFNNNAIDSSGNPTRNGSVNGILSYVTDRFGNPNSAASSNGSLSNWVDVPNVPLFAGSDTTTFAFWVKFNTNTGTLLERRNATANNYELTNHISPVGITGLHGKNTTPGWSSTGIGAGVAAISHIPDLQKYYHIVFVKNNNFTSIYIDGVQRANDNIGTINTANNNGNILYLFHNPGGGFVGPLTGAMDSFMYFNVALSATQVQELYNQDLD